MKIGHIEARSKQQGILLLEDALANTTDPKTKDAIALQLECSKVLWDWIERKSGGPLGKTMLDADMAFQIVTCATAAAAGIAGVAISTVMKPAGFPMACNHVVESFTKMLTAALNEPIDDRRGN